MRKIMILIFFFFVIFRVIATELSLRNYPVMVMKDLNNQSESIVAHSHIRFCNARPVVRHSSLAYYACCSIADFQEIFAYESEKEILSNYELFSLANFQAYACTLVGYDDFILSLEEKIKQNKKFRKQTAYISGFSYHFGFRGEKSGFHDFVIEQANKIRKKQSQKRSSETKGIFHIYDAHELDQLEQQWELRKKITLDRSRLNDRLNAIRVVRSTHGTELDKQLRKELSESRNAMKQLERNFGYNCHVRALAPFVYHNVAQAKQERSLIKAFGLSDFCHVVTQVLSHGMYVFYDAAYAVGKGICNGVKTVVTIDHWKDMATGILHMGLLVAESIGHEEDSHFAIARALFSENPDVVMQFSKEYYVQVKQQEESINRYVKHTYEKIKTIPWQEVLENGTEIGMTMILDTLALHAMSGFSRVTSNALIKQISQAVEGGVLFQEGYAAEVAGFGKLVVEEGAEVGGLTISKFNATNEQNKNIIKSIKDSIQSKNRSLLIERGGKFSESEKRAAQYMYEAGNDVILRMPKGTRVDGGTSDLLVNGISYDVYTPITKNPDRIITAIASKKDQAEGIILDLSHTSVTVEQLGNIKARLAGKGAENIREVIVLK